jgi:predicted RNase H-like HicB family nuclease
METKYLMTIAPVRKDEHGVNYIVSYPEFPGLTGGGDTIEEACEVAQEALSMYLETNPKPKENKKDREWAIELLNIYRNRYFRSGDKKEYALFEALDTVLPDYYKLRNLVKKGK